MENINFTYTNGSLIEEVEIPHYSIPQMVEIGGEIKYFSLIEFAEAHKNTTECEMNLLPNLVPKGFCKLANYEESSEVPEELTSLLSELRSITYECSAQYLSKFYEINWDQENEDVLLRFNLTMNSRNTTPEEGKKLAEQQKQDSKEIFVNYVLDNQITDKEAQEKEFTKWSEESSNPVSDLYNVIEDYYDKQLDDYSHHLCGLTNSNDEL